MKVTPDTNILLSATFWYGDSFKILEMAENKKINLILSEEIIDELSQVFEYEEIKGKIKDKGLEMKRTIEQIREISTIVKPTQKVDVVKEDPDDNKIIECALEGRADYIVSNDNHLLKLKEYNNIKIFSPRKLLDILERN